MHDAAQTLTSAAGPSAEEARILANLSKREKLTESQAKARLAIISKIQPRRVDLANPPTDQKPRWMLAGKSIATPGNLCGVQAQAGTGKSAFVGALVAARIVAEFGKTDCDCLGVQADSEAKGNLYLIDTEQSRFDLYTIVVRLLRRAGVDKIPEWLHVYGLAGYSAIQLKKIVAALLWEAELDGAYGVIIDGIADLCADVNDAEECNAFVARLHELAIKHDCPIICVLHENPGSENGKGRGHLGSQLERKAESVLRLQKTDEVTAIFSKKARRAPITEKEAPRFRWSNDAGMHVSCETIASSKDDAKREKLRDMAEAVFMHAGKTGLRYADLLKAIAEVRRISPSTAEDRFSQMKQLNVITKNVISHEWQINPVAP
jgi:hypothetical protein